MLLNIFLNGLFKIKIWKNVQNNNLLLFDKTVKTTKCYAIKLTSGYIILCNLIYNDYTPFKEPRDLIVMVVTVFRGDQICFMESSFTFWIDNDLSVGWVSKSLIII